MIHINLERSREILKMLRQEGIRTLENTSGREHSEVDAKIICFRAILDQAWNQKPAPGLTRCAALTFTKLGACQELAQRFALEYFVRYGEANVSLVITANESDLTKNHCFVLVGPVVAAPELKMTNELAKKENYVSIRDFFARQSANSAIADPLTDFAGVANGPCSQVVSYCEREGITKVIGISTYAESILGVSEQVKVNAQKLAEKVMRGMKSHESDQAQSRQSPEALLLRIIKKCKLDPVNAMKITVREQALRRAAAFGTLEDVELLLSTGIDINAQDENPMKRNTALHLALMNKKLDVAKYLISQGARIDIANADKLTADTLIRESGMKIV